MIQEETTTTPAGAQDSTPFPIGKIDSAELLRTHVVFVRDARLTLAALKAQVERLRQDWTLANADVLDALDEAKADLAAKEGILRQLAVMVYQETGTKRPAAGVGIREVTTYRYDEPRVRAWAVRHQHAVLLRCDDEAVKRAGVAMEIPTFEVGTEPAATIATDLTKSLEGN